MKNLPEEFSQDELEAAQEWFAEDTEKEKSPTTQQQTDQTQPHYNTSNIGQAIEPEQDVFEPLGYFINEVGEFCHGFMFETKKGPVYKVMKLANFKPVPVAEYWKDNGQEQNIFLEIEGTLAETGKPLPRVLLAAEEFDAMKWVTKYWGYRATVYTGRTTRDHIRVGIQQLVQNIPTYSLYTHLGWRNINGTWTYLHAGGSIGESVRVELDHDKLKRYVLPTEPVTTDTLGAGFAASLQLLEVAPYHVSMPLMAMIGLAPLCEIGRQLDKEPNFVLWFEAASGSRKSSLTAAFMCHYGRFDKNNLTASFRDTLTALEQKAFYAKDTIFIVDDYYPPKTKKEWDEMEQKAQYLLRAYGDRVGRERSNGKLEIQKTYVPRGLCIVTGEQTPSASTSTAARLYHVKMEKSDVNLETLSAVQEQRHLLPYVGRAYIQWVAANFDRLKESIEQEYKKVFTGIQQRGGLSHGRLEESATWLFIGLKIYLTFMTEQGYLAKEDRKQLLEQAADVLINNAKQHSYEIEDEAPANQFLQTVAELFNANRIKVEPVVKKDGDQYPSEQGVNVGYYDDEYYYFTPKLLYNEVMQVFAKQNKVFPLNARALWKELEQKGHIFTRTDNRGCVERTPKISIGNKKPRLLWVKCEALEQEEGE